MSVQRFTQHTIAILTLVVILIFNGCAMPMAQPATAPAGGDSAAGERPAEEAAAAEAPAATSGGAAAPASDGAAPAADSSASGSTYSPDRSGQFEAVTAGVTDDNEGWNDYLDYLNRHSYDLYVNRRDVSERYLIRVLDERSIPVHDAHVTIYQNERELFNGRTDAGGQMFFFPQALDNPAWQQAGEFRVVAEKGYVAQSQNFSRQSGEQWTLSLTNPPRPNVTQLDLVFLIDATGSMGDESDKLKASMADVADQIANLPENPDTRYGLVAYRDQGDEFIVRTHDFTPNLDRFQRDLANVFANGGGDTPEALNEALHRSLNDMSWRGEDTVRLIVLVADAPPHIDYHWENFSYDRDMFEAVRQGIKIFPVGASNLEADGEYVFRQLAQVTGGKFVFLTYEEGSDPSSGPGTETDHEVDNYSVDTLDRLVVRLVREELAKLSSTVQISQQPQPQPTPMPTPTQAPPQQLTCTVDFVSNWTDCGDTSAIAVIERSYNSALLGLTLVNGNSGIIRARFDITYGSAARDYSVNIGDAMVNGVYDSGSSEVAIHDSTLQVYGNSATPPNVMIDTNRTLMELEDVARSGETVSLEVSSQRLGLNYAGGIEVVDSPYLFNFSQRPGDLNLYAAFNRTISGSQSGSSVSKVVITLYPAQ